MIMRIKLILAAAIAAAIGLSSCSGDAKLAGELAGTWKGNTTQMKDSKHENHDKDRHHSGRSPIDDGEMSCTPTLTFVKSEGTNGGTVNIAATYTITKGVESAVISTPVKATVNGNFNASGTWVVKDGDEIVINLDAAKTTVAVDTASLALNYAKLTDAPVDSLNALKGRIASNITDAISPMIIAKVSKMHKFDDVKISGTTMTLEAHDNNLTFTKQ